MNKCLNTSGLDYFSAFKAILLVDAIKRKSESLKTDDEGNAWTLWTRADCIERRNIWGISKIIREQGEL